MTERLYYQNSFLREFDARVLSCGASGEIFQVVLNQSAFYPTSGGQPHDTGQLGEVRVLNVNEREDGSIVHCTDRALPVGPVHGKIDWERRFDHMQQHTGQHILSATFILLFKAPTVSFHLGREICTIDLEMRSLVERQVVEAEQLANRVVFDDVPVNIRFGTAAELAAEGIRKAVDREGMLRVIEIEKIDRQPCGGTHVARTGQVGAIQLRKFEKQKQFWRVEFVCGKRAVAWARHDLDTLTNTARIFNCGLADVPALVHKTVEEAQAGQRAERKLIEELAGQEARALLAPEAVSAEQAPRVQRIRPVIVRVFEEANADFLRIVAAKMVSEPSVQVLLGTRAGGHVVFAQSPGGPNNMNELLRESLAVAGGKGGGSRDFAQGRLENAARMDDVLKHAATHLEG